MADLVQPLHDIARREQAGDRGSLMVVHLQAAILARTRAGSNGKFRADVRAKRRIDGVEREVAFGGADDEAIPRDPIIAARSVDPPYAGVVERVATGIV